MEKHEKLYGIDEAPGATAPFGAPLKATNNYIGLEPDHNQIPTGQIFKAGDGGRGGGPEQQILQPGNSRMEVDISVEHNAANPGRKAETSADKLELVEDSDALRFQRIGGADNQRRPFKIEARDIILKNFHDT